MNIKLLFIENTNLNIKIKIFNINLKNDDINKIQEIIINNYQNYEELVNNIIEINNKTNPDTIFIDKGYFEYVTEKLKEKIPNKINAKMIKNKENNLWE